MQNERMTDPRILDYKRAAEFMAHGEFHVDVPVRNKGDEVDELGLSLVRLGQALDRRFEEIRRLAAVTERINAGLLLDDVLSFVYESFSELIPYDRIGVSILESNNTLVRARWARSEAPRMEISRGYSARLNGSSLKTILDTGVPRILNDLEAYLEAHPESESTRRIVREGMRSSLTCPLIALNKPIGFMFFSSFGKNTYRDLHRDVFLRIAGQLSVIVEKSRLYQELLELSDLKTRFLGFAAHDLRNPLSVIQAYLRSYFEEEASLLSPDQLRAIGIMGRACDSICNLIETFLDIHAIESGRLLLKPERVEVESFLAEAVAQSDLLARAKSMSLSIEGKGAPRFWMFDPYRIQQVLYNLISNAMKYSRPGTEIVLRARSEDGTLALSVIDHGQGIPEHEISNLFVEYGRASLAPTGNESSTGLGLAICKRIVEAHGGTLAVESKVGEGSVFSLMLPVEVPAPEPG